jgi:NUMOD3 motif
MSDATEPLPFPAREVSARYATRSPEYYAVHAQIRQHRGPARNQQCARCDGPARHWARLHETDGSDIWADYVPMCPKCHMTYDLGDVPKSDEHRAKISEYAQNRTDDHRQKLSESLTGRVGGMTGKHHSEESKQRSRASQPNLGRKLPEETREKMRLAAQRRWARKRAEAEGVTDGTPGSEGRSVPGPGPEDEAAAS